MTFDATTNRTIDQGPRVEEWTLTERLARLWTIGSVGLTVVGVALFAGLYASVRGSGNVSIQGWRLFGAIALIAALTLPLYVVHEWIHGWTMARFGARPTYGWGAIGGVPGYLYCTAHEHRFSRLQFAAIALAPCLLISSIGALAIATLPWGGWLVVPLGFHFGGCVGDFWAVALVLSKPRGTQVEDLQTGVRFHLADHAAQG
jgi:hypothetical protein